MLTHEEVRKLYKERKIFIEKSLKDLEYLLKKAFDLPDLLSMQHELRSIESNCKVLETIFQTYFNILKKLE